MEQMLKLTELSTGDGRGSARLEHSALHVVAGGHRAEGRAAADRATAVGAARPGEQLQLIPGLV